MNCLGDWNSQFLICRSIYQKSRILRSWGWGLTIHARWFFWVYGWTSAWRGLMTGIFGILESSATQWCQDVAPTQELFFHRPIYSLCIFCPRPCEYSMLTTGTPTYLVQCLVLRTREPCSLELSEIRLVAYCRIDESTEQQVQLKGHVIVRVKFCSFWKSSLWLRAQQAYDKIDHWNTRKICGSRFRVIPSKQKESF
jgi:hypothetical protein